MIRILLLWLSVFLSLVFLWFPHKTVNGVCVDHCLGFMYSDVVVSYKKWVYDFCEHLILVVLASVIASFIYKFQPQYKITAFVFLCIQIADTVDYCLTYGDSWTDGPITFNTLKCAIFGVSIAFDIMKSIHNGRNTETH